jgi:predicted lipid-binding transport protein (Tim44 family)
MGGGFPIDLILFGMIAAFLVLRLRGILGKRTGFERPPTVERPMGAMPVGGGAAGPIIEGRAEPVRTARPLPEPSSPVGVTLVRMRGVDRNFDPQHFLNGAEAAFRMIVAAFAAGDRVQLRALLADDTYRSFETAIAAREAAGETQRSEVRSIEAATIEAAVLNGSVADITVKFVSDQIAETLGSDGRPVAGADAVTEITDIWTFTRDLTQPDPAWRLSAARSG